MKSLKSIILSLSVILIAVTVAFADTGIQTTTFKVWGNCSSCKKHIETALKTGGVSKASWNENTKKLTVSYDPKKISIDQIHHKIAAAGYDTDKIKGDDKAYKQLDDCCKYSRKAQ